MEVSQPLIDLSYLEEISGNDASYIAEVVGIFIDTMAEGLPVLEDLVLEGTDYEKIHKQAHFLKSSAGIIKVRNSFEMFVKINSLSLSKSGLSDIRYMFNIIKENFAEALPELERLKAGEIN